MKKGKQLPSWISEMKSNEERALAIDALSSDDVFRNQSRTEVSATKCALEVMNWGLQHIERLTQAAADKREEKSRSIGHFITVFSLFIALATVGTSLFSIREQSDLKRYEVTFKPKQTAYSDFMSAFDETSVAAFKHDDQKTLADFVRMETAFLSWSHS
jgi:hypothetical protein